MATYQFVSRARHGEKSWRRRKGYKFAATETVAPLTAREFPKAAIGMPIAFILVKGALVPVAVLGIEAGTNVLVKPDGLWIGGYVPAVYRGYPFQLMFNAEGKQALAVDEDSGLLNEDGEGESFFGEDGKPSSAVNEMLDFVNKLDGDRRITTTACAELQRYGVIKPWPVTAGEGDEKRTLPGLFCVDESALNKLPDEGFLALRKAGALMLAHCQLLSMQNLELLRALAAQRAARTPDLARFTQNETLDLSHL